MARALGAALLCLVAATAAWAQSDFRITHTVERRGPEQVDVKGMVFNDARLHANNVTLTIYALDASGAVIARTNAYLGTVAQQDSAGFSARLKAGPAMTNVRVTVTSYRLGVFPQGP
ncbi:MAG: hypothetical protein FJ027_10985 [Candidatus Rokubacteria bacterium]|nr:hypothetical protein [Candidatus Rokubacteria bacterium]